VEKDRGREAGFVRAVGEVARGPGGRFLEEMRFPVTARARGVTDETEVTELLGACRRLLFAADPTALISRPPSLSPAAAAGNVILSRCCLDALSFRLASSPETRGFRVRGGWSSVELLEGPSGDAVPFSLDLPSPLLLLLAEAAAGVFCDGDIGFFPELVLSMGILLPFDEAGLTGGELELDDGSLAFRSAVFGRLEPAGFGSLFFGGGEGMREEDEELLGSSG
jgi:hypothetical protein